MPQQRRGALSQNGSTKFLGKAIAPAAGSSDSAKLDTAAGFTQADQTVDPRKAIETMYPLRYRPGDRVGRIGLVSAWASRLGGGVFEAVVAHADLVAALGYEPVVFALADEHSATDRERFGAIEVRTFPTVGPAMVGYAPALASALLAAELDLVHLHGIWMYPSQAASRWAARTKRPYVISPHGMLDPWILGRGKLKKAIARMGYERRSWRRASRFHVLTEAEAADVGAATARDDSIVIPNAVPLAAGAADRQPALVYLGRIHPKKNIAALVAGWRQARDVLRPIGATLRIAGWGEPEHVEALRQQLAADGGDDFAFLGPVYGAEKAALIGSARFVVLPSHSEGLPVAILEAWAAGTPTLMSQHCHLPEGYARGAAIDCGTDAAEIAAALRRAFTLPEARWREMADAASGLVRDRFAPEAVAQRWREAYGALIRPSVDEGRS
jgi:poly(glycerol-phosphate) alpha-glucosyltransferase